MITSIRQKIRRFIAIWRTRRFVNRIFKAAAGSKKAFEKTHLPLVRKEMQEGLNPLTVNEIKLMKGLGLTEEEYRLDKKYIESFMQINKLRF